MSALGTLLFVFAVLASIGLHEFGHFITAKRFGIKVEQFFIGFGPRLWSVRKGETEYGVKALPLGGFVRIAGMNPYEEIAEEDRARVFKSRKPWQRAIVLAAGSFTHFVLALFILAGILMIVGEPDYKRPTTTVSAVAPTLGDDASPAARAGLRGGDVIVEIAGRPIRAWNDAVEVIRDRGGQQTSIVVMRDGARVTLDTVISPVRPDGTRAGYLGVGPEPTYVRRGPIAAVGGASAQIGRGIKESALAFKHIFSPSTIGRLLKVAAGNEERRVDDPATVVGIGAAAGGLANSGDFVGLFYLIAGLNIFIGVANLLPLPPLDGGHLAVLAYEKVRKREVDVRRLMPLTATVISVFGSLFVLLLYLDIVRPLPPIPG